MTLDTEPNTKERVDILLPNANVSGQDTDSVIETKQEEKTDNPVPDYEMNTIPSDDPTTLALHRERFLRLLLKLADKPAEFSLHGGTHVKGVFQAVDSTFENIAVSHLQTPGQGICKAALLRTSDVDYFTSDSL